MQMVCFIGFKILKTLRNSNDQILLTLSTCLACSNKWYNVPTITTNPSTTITVNSLVKVNMKMLAS